MSFTDDNYNDYDDYDPALAQDYGNEFCDDKIVRRSLQLAGPGKWKTKLGLTIKIRDMKDSHLRNSIMFLERSEVNQKLGELRAEGLRRLNETICVYDCALCGARGHTSNVSYGPVTPQCKCLPLEGGTCDVKAWNSAQERIASKISEGL